MELERFKKKQEALWPDPDVKIMFADSASKGRNRLQKMKAQKIPAVAEQLSPHLNKLLVSETSESYSKLIS